MRHGEMDIDLDVEDNELGFFAEQTFQQLPSAPSSTPNSVASSPPVTSDDIGLTQNGSFHNNCNQIGNAIGIADDKSYLKRGPGRPRKEFPIQLFNGFSKMQKKSKSAKDLQQLIERGVPTPLSIPQLSSDNSNMGFPDEKPSPSLGVEDLPYFTEKYPGKVCCLCNLSERSALGQGDFLRVKATSEEHDVQELNNLTENEKFESRENAKTDKTTQAVRGRVKNSNKNRFFPNNENINELDKVGQIEPLTLKTLLDGSYFYVHRMCAVWSTGLNRSINEEMLQLEEVVARSLKRKCKLCGQYGASVTCKMNCEKAYHLPCAAASGCFLIIENLTAFCPDHLHQVPFMCTETNVDCRHCCALGDIAKLIMCSTCGDHYHTTCIGLANFPDTRSGWNCQQCSKCQICRLVDATEGRSVKCEHCQKLYHATCLRPIISSIPKYGWKCNRCRVCTDCGSRTPGAGTSSRWHCHYTICDSCYQQRNKGFSCPICHKAYRAAAHKEMVKCSSCNRFVHSSCDEEADLSVYHKKKENNPDYDYYCPPCKLNLCSDRSQLANNQMRTVGESTDMLALSSMSASDNQYKDADMEYYEKNFVDYNITDGKSIEALKISKKRMGFKIFPRSRSGKMVLQKPGMLTQFSRRRGGRGKSRHLMLMSSSDSGMSERGSNRCSDDDWNMEKKMVLFSAKDKFLLSQDICVMCGSVGIDQDGCLIACTQCGQCYHPYCANIKISLVVLQKGWRCLDCTVCEGCGQKNDEACLILCDECDISYHTYCMSPPLDKVPHGNWKCKWCAVCQKCGRNSPGRNCTWRNGFLECGPCASQRACCVCMQQYVENELIIQCNNCERWLHCQCDNINNEKEAQLCDTDDYTCILCRPKNKQFAHPFVTKVLLKSGASSKDTYTISSPILNLSGDRLEASLERISALNVASNDSGEFNESTHCLDGVCVTERGLSAIKALSLEIKRKRKMRPANDALNKDSGILATIESVVAGSANANPDEDGADDEAQSKQKSEIYKDGMVWPYPENSPPQGFSIVTNDEGVNILRKKRQRNLQKLGIGGFSVRNRALKKDCDDNGVVVGTEQSTATESEKKKKIVRKKTKTKLSETYPTYLQEAFFGKALLENKEMQPSFCESDSSDELGHGNFALIGYEKHAASSNEKSTVQSSIKQEKDTNLLTVVKTELDTHLLNVKPNALMSPADTIGVPVHPSHNTIIIQKVPADGKELILETQKVKCTPTNLMSDNCSDAKDVINKAVLNITTTRMASGTLPKPAPLELQLHNNNTNLSIQMPHNETLMPQHLQQPQEMQKILQQSPHVPTQLAENSHLNKAEQQMQPILQENQQHTIKESMTKLYIAPTQNDEPSESVVVGSQKTAEKMRRDEDLGEMATISAVLYANTQHPELKQIYPNWNDRCKQIIKRWRSLSNEKKTPFLQHAKDNRSALRMRKAQQDQEKICFQQKSLKEQEQERIWKQHQAKAKEAMTSPFNSVNFGSDSMPLDVKVPNMYNSNCIMQDNTPATFNANLMPNNVFMPSVSVIPMQRNISSIDAPNFLLEKTESSESIVPDTDNKQLRTLLLKQDYESSWLPDAPIATQSTLLPHADVVGPPSSLAGGVLTNVKQGNDLKSQLLMQINKNVKTSANIAINKVDFKARTDVKAADCTDAIGASELEKMDQDENVGFGDILGGFGEGDDEDFLKSLTANIGDDFNILEYGDPELDELATSQNLLQKLDFDDNYKNT